MIREKSVARKTGKVKKSAGRKTVAEQIAKWSAAMKRSAAERTAAEKALLGKAGQAEKMDPAEQGSRTCCAEAAE